MSQVLVYSKRNREMSYLSAREERETKPNRFQVVYNDISDEEAELLGFYLAEGSSYFNKANKGSWKLIFNI